MQYTKIFDPDQSAALQGHAATPQADEAAPPLAQGGDRRDGLVYVYTDQIVLAVNVALSTQRPLLVRGRPGSGKSSLAGSVALHLQYRYYEHVVSSRTQARDLLWQFDTLRRLNDAQAKSLQAEDAYYVDPGVLWWAFDPESAERRGGTEELRDAHPAKNPSSRTAEQAVVLIDEIDKADPDVPNDLLVPLGSLEFNVTDIGLTVQGQQPPLLVITTNDERELPAAFVRRCVVVVLPDPDENRLITIGQAHFGAQHKALYQSIAAQVLDADRSKPSPRQIVPSTAEFLDTVRACIRLNIDPQHQNWEALTKATLWKPRGPLGTIL